MTAASTASTNATTISPQGVIRACPACGARNRTSPQHLADAGHCGRCKGALGPIDQPLDVDADGFAEIVRGARVPVLVDFWAAWCGPCRLAAPVVKGLAGDLSGKLIVLKVDSDQNGQVAARYGVQGIPNFVVLRNGQVVAQRAGFVPAPEMKRWLAGAGVAGVT